MSDIQSESMLIRLTTEEKAKIKARAESVGMKMSEWVRGKLTEDEPPPKPVGLVPGDDKHPKFKGQKDHLGNTVPYLPNVTGKPYNPYWSGYYNK